MSTGRIDRVPAKYRIHPFWFWNGEMEENQIEYQTQEMARKGIGGYFLCARQGMKIPYLSEEWFCKVRFAIEIAGKCGLDVWLYDEYPYPSGIAGGDVILKHPDAKHRVISHKKTFAMSGEEILLNLPWGTVLTAVATPINPATGGKKWNQSVDIREYIGNNQLESVYQETGLTNYNQKRFFTYGTIKQLRWKAPEQNWELNIFVEKEIDDFKYYGTFVDPGHAEAMHSFISITHERYKQKIGDYFGSVVKGMFTDEIGYLGEYPWSSRLLNFFEQKNGYALGRELIALTDSEYPGSTKIRYDYFQASHLLLRESYHKQVHDWCEENGLEYVAEVPSMRMTTQLYSHVVGSDSAHDKLGRTLDWVIDTYHQSFRSNPKMASSLARQLGREGALVECFHSIGWSMTLQDAKWMIDRMAAMGINFFNFHAFFYTINGLVKHDAPPSLFIQMPFWKHFRILSDYVGRLSYLLSQGEPVRQIALLDPTTSLWTHLGNPMREFTYIGDSTLECEQLNRLKKDWLELGKSLLLHQIDYDHLDAELLENAKVSSGTLEIGNAKYTTLILPPMTNIEFVAWKKIRQFLMHGGQVIAVGLLPYEKIEDESPNESELLQVFNLVESPRNLYWNSDSEFVYSDSWTKGNGGAFFIYPCAENSDEFLADHLSKLLNEIDPPAVRIRDTEAQNSFLMQCRVLEDSYLIFVTNQEEAGKYLSLEVNLARLCKDMHIQKQGLKFDISEYVLETGESSSVKYEYKNGTIELMLDFHAYESRLIELHSSKNQQMTVTDMPNIVPKTTTSPEPWQLILSRKREWELKPLQFNIVRFDRFNMALKNHFDAPDVMTKTFVEQCSDVQDNERLSIMFDKTFGIPPKIKISYPQDCVYKVEFMVKFIPGVCQILLDSGAVYGNNVISVNEIKVSLNDFRSEFVYDHSNVTYDISKLVKYGRNSISIEVEVNHDWDGVVDAIYLRGDFGVQFDSACTPVITQKVQSAELNGGPYPGHPFYAGDLSFKTSFQLETIPENSTFELIFEDWDPDFHDCAEVYLNGENLGVRAWIPYVWNGETSLLTVGENFLEIRVTNTLVGTLEGKYFDYQEHRLKSVTDLS